MDEKPSKAEPSSTAPGSVLIVPHDEDPSSTHLDQEQAIREQLRAMSAEEYAQREKALLWKIDKRLIPWLT
jgi:hypothetical protein